VKTLKQKGPYFRIRVIYKIWRKIINAIVICILLSAAAVIKMSCRQQKNKQDLSYNHLGGFKRWFNNNSNSYKKEENSSTYNICNTTTEANTILPKASTRSQLTTKALLNTNINTTSNKNHNNNNNIKSHEPVREQTTKHKVYILGIKKKICYNYGKHLRKECRRRVLAVPSF